MVDTCHFIRIQVRYTAVFAKPQIDAIIKGKISSITSTADRVSVGCIVEGGLQTIVSSVDTTKFALKEEEGANKKNDLSDSEDEMKEADVDSIFDEAEANVKTEGLYLEDIKRGKELKIGSKVKLQIKKIVVSEGKLIPYAELV